MHTFSFACKNFERNISQTQHIYFIQLKLSHGNFRVPGINLKSWRSFLNIRGASSQAVASQDRLVEWQWQTAASKEVISRLWGNTLDGYKRPNMALMLSLLCSLWHLVLFSLYYCLGRISEMKRSVGPTCH